MHYYRNIHRGGFRNRGKSPVFAKGSPGSEALGGGRRPRRRSGAGSGARSGAGSGARSGARSGAHVPCALLRAQGGRGVRWLVPGVLLRAQGGRGVRGHPAWHPAGGGAGQGGGGGRGGGTGGGSCRGGGPRGGSRRGGGACGGSCRGGGPRGGSRRGGGSGGGTQARARRGRGLGRGPRRGRRGTDAVGPAAPRPLLVAPDLVPPQEVANDLGIAIPAQPPARRGAAPVRVPALLPAEIALGAAPPLGPVPAAPPRGPVAELRARALARHRSHGGGGAGGGGRGGRRRGRGRGRTSAVAAAPHALLLHLGPAHPPRPPVPGRPAAEVLARRRAALARPPLGGAAVQDPDPAGEVARSRRLGAEAEVLPAAGVGARGGGR